MNRRFGLFLAALVFALVAPHVSAQSVGKAPLSGAYDAVFQRVITGSAAGVSIQDLHPVQIGGKTVHMTATRALLNAPLATLAKAARVASPAGALATVAAAGWCQYTTGSLVCAAPQDPVNTAATLFKACHNTSSCNAVGWHSSQQAAADDIAAWFNATAAVTQGTYEGQPCSIKNSSHRGVVVGNNWIVEARPIIGGCQLGANYVTVQGGSFGSQQGTVQQCPPVVDFFDPKYSRPGGPMVNGKCPSSTYGPATQHHDDAMAARVATMAAADKVSMFNEIRSQVDPAGFTSNQTLSGPASVTGQSTTTTTTGSNGQPVTTTTTQTHNITYSDSSYYVTTITQTTVNEGSTVISETTTETSEQGEPVDPCKLNPQSAGCASLDVPSDTPVPEVVRDVQFEPDARFSGSGSCPAPRSLNTVLAGTLTWSYQPLCDFAEGVRPLVVAFAALAGAMIFVGAARQGD